VIGSDEPPTVIVALIASESSKSKDSGFAYSGSSTIVYVPVTGKGSQEMRRLDGELSRLTAGGRERRRPAGPPGGTQGAPGAARALRASVDRAGRDRADRPPRHPAPGARDPPPLGRLAGDAAARGSRGAGDPPEPRRRPDRVQAPPGGSDLRVLRAGVVRTAPGGNHQSSVGGDPGGIWSNLDAGISRSCGDALSRAERYLYPSRGLIRALKRRPRASGCGLERGHRLQQRGRYRINVTERVVSRSV